MALLDCTRQPQRPIAQPASTLKTDGRPWPRRHASESPAQVSFGRGNLLDGSGAWCGMAAFSATTREEADIAGGLRASLRASFRGRDLLKDQ